VAKSLIRRAYRWSLSQEFVRRSDSSALLDAGVRHTLAVLTAVNAFSPGPTPPPSAIAPMPPDMDADFTVTETNVFGHERVTVVQLKDYPEVLSGDVPLSQIRQA
jgi:hypothetical protein